MLLDRRGVVAGSVEVTVAETGVKAGPGADFTVNGRSGTLLRNPRGALVVGEALTVRYVPLPISRVSTEAGAKAFSMLLPNTAVPPPPVVAEVIPSFAQGADGTRSGQVLRVYLARPWLVTGEGEQLAVIVEADGSPGSVVGRDPITTGTGRDLTLTGDAFPRATSVVTDGGRTVVAHAVSFDPAANVGTPTSSWVRVSATGRSCSWWWRGTSRTRSAGRPCRRPSPSSRSGSAWSARPRSSGAGASSRRSSRAPGTWTTRSTSGWSRPTRQPDPDLTWQPVGDPVRLAVAGPGTRRCGPGPRRGPAKGRLRVVVEEVEPGRRTEGQGRGRRRDRGLRRDRRAAARLIARAALYPPTLS